MVHGYISIFLPPQKRLLGLLKGIVTLNITSSTLCVLLGMNIGILGYNDGSVGAAIVAVLLVHVVIAGYVYAAWNEGNVKID